MASTRRCLFPGLLLLFLSPSVRAVSLGLRMEEGQLGLTGLDTSTPGAGFPKWHRSSVTTQDNRQQDEAATKLAAQNLRATSPEELWRSCGECPSSRWFSHSGYKAFAHWTAKVGAGNLLPLNYCPPRPKAALAAEAIHALAAAGYTRTASYLNSTGLLLGLTSPATLLAPNNDAFEPGNLPPRLCALLEATPKSDKNRVHAAKEGAFQREALAEGGGQRESFEAWGLRQGVVKNLLLHHLLEEFLTYDEFMKRGQGAKGSASRLETRLGGSTLAARGFSFERDVASFVAFESEAPAGRSHRSVVLRKDLFCNALVSIQGVSQVLLPPLQHLPAQTPPAPTSLAITLALAQQD